MQARSPQIHSMVHDELAVNDTHQKKTKWVRPGEKHAQNLSISRPISAFLVSCGSFLTLDPAVRLSAGLPCVEPAGRVPDDLSTRFVAAVAHLYAYKHLAQLADNPAQLDAVLVRIGVVMFVPTSAFGQSWISRSVSATQHRPRCRRLVVLGRNHQERNALSCLLPAAVILVDLKQCFLVAGELSMIWVSAHRLHQPELFLLSSRSL